MTAQELRIGNWVSYRGEKEGVVSSIGSNGFETIRVFNTLPFGSSDLEEYEPIPLTEEWLLRFGFEVAKAYDSINRYSKGKFELYSCPNPDNWAYEYAIMVGKISIELKHVHQLQNLYYALTGEELEYKP